MTAIPRDPPANTPGIRTLGTASVQAAPGDDTRFPASGALTVKASYLGTPLAEVFYASYDIAGNVIQARTAFGVVESTINPGLYYYDQVVSLDQFIAQWDENDGLDPAIEVIATRHVVKSPSPPTGVTAVGGDTQATITFTPGDNGGAAVTAYTATAIDSTNVLHGGQTQSGVGSGLIVSGLTNGESYTFTVTATTSFGTSVASTASNAVVPAVVLHVPDAPTSATAAAAVGQATVSWTVPANNGGAAITGYTVTAVDETTPANGGQTHSGTANPQTVTGLVNADTYHFTVHATNSVGNSAESLATNSVTIPSGAGSPVATFTYTQPTSSTILLDASASTTGTATWTFDGTAASGTARVLQIGPVTVGHHTVGLSINNGTAGVGATSLGIDAAWVGRPLGDAQHDATNGSGPSVTSIGYYVPAGGGTVSTSTLPQWASQPAIGPWRNKSVLNMAEGYPGAGDGTARITVIDTNHITLLTKYGDRPGTAGGYRSAMEYSTAYSGTAAGYQFSAPGDVNVCGNIGTARTGSVRFYRLDIMFPGTNPGGPTCPDPAHRDGVWDFQNNAFEIHGNAGGSSPVRFETLGNGKNWQWTFESKVGGTSGGSKSFDSRLTLYDTWYLYIIELLLSLDTVGYFRVWRDTGAGYQPITTNVPTGTILTPGADLGKYFSITQQTTPTGSVVAMAHNLQNYRTKASLPAGYPDALIHYRNVLAGPTMASVLV